MRRSILFVITFFCISYTTQSQSVREKINFDDDWKFHFGHAADAKKDFNFSIAPIFSKTGKADDTAIDEKFDDRTWKQITLPHDWAVELPFVQSDNFDVMAHGYKPVGGLFPETSIGWYRKKFTIAEIDSGKRFTIQFDGIFRDSKVWLNGFYLGNNESGYIGATYDITDFIDFHSENVLVVRVDASQYEGWFYEGAGIYRHVWLNKFDNAYIDDVFIYTKILNQTAQVEVETSIQNKNDYQVMASLGIVISDRNGKQITDAVEESLILAPKQKLLVKKQLVVKSPNLWSVENPYQYKIYTTLKVNRKIADQHVQKFGVRTIEFSKVKGLLVNGAATKIKGANCHQDHSGVGSALPDYLQYYRIRLLKEMGANAYRTSHHAPTPELLEACDSLGMLVLDETRLLNSAPEYMDQFERLILRDRNHPSVFMWSIGNEEGYAQTNSHGKRIALNMMNKQRVLDPTRLSTYAADLGNVFSGINEVIPVRGFNYREKFIVPYHKDHPDQPIIGTEMGSTVTTRGIYTIDSVKGYVPDQDITAPWWASTAEAWWPIAADNAWFSGGFIWTGFDYRGEPTPFKWPNINSHFGIMDMCGFPKNIYYYYQSWWSDKDVLHISPHWNWRGKEGQFIDVWVNSNADEVELFLSGKSLGRKKMPANSHLRWNVKYKPGTLEAVAYKKGRKFETKIETTDIAYKVVLTPDKKVLAADGKDISIINIAVADRNGKEVPDANISMHFALKGKGRILGGGNGDPSSHEADQTSDNSYQRSLFNGKCQIIVQSGKTPGNMELEVTADGLIKSTLIIETKSSKELKVSMQ